MKPLIDALSEASLGAPWVVNARKFASQLDPAGDLNLARIVYGRFRNETLLQFYRVDTALKALCGEILEIGRPLNSLLSEVPNG